jgi:hypothetical protein
VGEDAEGPARGAEDCVGSGGHEWVRRSQLFPPRNKKAGHGSAQRLATAQSVAAAVDAATARALEQDQKHVQQQ